MHRFGTLRRTIAFVALSISPALVATRATAQGCEPIRFTTPAISGDGQAYQRGREWQFTLAYRRLTSNEWFIGRRDRSTLAPGGESPVFNVNTVVADVAYAINERFRVRASIPVSKASLSRRWPDKLVHEQVTTGLGDLSVMGEAWILDPRAHSRGNIGIGLGIKAPTGSHTIGSQFYTASGSVDFPADQTIQPGDGGWALLSQIQAFRQVTGRTFAYASGSYMVSPKARTEVRFSPTSAQYWSVPDVYSVRLGTAFSVLPDRGLSLSLGGRVDGIPVHDLLGGGDATTIKRTSYVVFADPGLSLTVGKGTVALSVPYRLTVNRTKSLFEQRTNGVNGGGFAKYLLFASYSYRL